MDLSLFLAEAQVAPIVLDGNFEIGPAFQAGRPSTGDAPAVSRGNESGNVTSSTSTYDWEDIDLTDVLYPHNLFLQVDVDMDASTGLVREGLGPELGIDFNDCLRTPILARPTRSTFLEMDPVLPLDHTEFELALCTMRSRRRQCALPQDSVRLLFRVPSTTTCPTVGRIRVRLQRASTSAVDRWVWPKPTPQASFAPTMPATASSTPTGKPTLSASCRPWTPTCTVQQ